MDVFSAHHWVVSRAVGWRRKCKLEGLGKILLEELEISSLVLLLLFLGDDVNTDDDNIVVSDNMSGAVVSLGLMLSIIYAAAMKG